MFKILIVDDEEIIRRGLKNIINWESLECVVCGEAGDGIEGINLIKELRPDIIIADINMPGIDGLKMIKETKSIIPDSKIIILTGYRDFAYIQEALKLGAFEYVLKPSKIEDLTAITKRAISEIKFKKEKEKEINDLKKHYEKRIPIIKQKMLYDIIFNINVKNDEIINELKIYNIDINDFVILLIETNDDNNDDDSSQMYLFGVVNTFEEIFSEDLTVNCITINNKKTVFIVQPKNEKDIAEKEIFMNIICKKAENLQNLIKKCFGFTITIAISKIGTGPYDLSKKTKEAFECLDYKLYMDKNSVILYDNIEKMKTQSDPSLLKSHEKKLIQSIKSGNDKNVKNVIKELFEYTSAKIFDSEKVKNIYSNIIKTVYKLKINNENKSDIVNAENMVDSVYEMFDNCTEITEFNAAFEEACVSVVSKVNNYNQKNVNQTLLKAIEYIKENYNKSITLTDVAEHTYVSIYYLCRMFTKEIGKNFVDYLNEIRIEKAKEYLINNNYKTYEVAELVGIKDAHYFSKIFKKYTGTTPSEFKTQQYDT